MFRIEPMIIDDFDAFEVEAKDYNDAKEKAELYIDVGNYWVQEL